MGKEEYNQYIANIRTFLASDAAQLFSTKNWERIFTDAVILK